MNEQILRLAVQCQRETIAALLPDVASPTELDLDLTGVPDASIAHVQAALRDDGWIRVIVMGLDDTVLEYTDWVVVDMPPLPPAAATTTPAWRRVPPTNLLMPEPQGVDDAGMDVIAQVNTKRNCWELTCSCGRKRYATKNNVRKVTTCRVCAKRQRRDYQNQWQQQRRQQSSSSPPTTTSPTTDVPRPSLEHSPRPGMSADMSTSSPPTSMTSLR